MGIETRAICASIERRDDGTTWECGHPCPPRKRLCDQCVNDTYQALQALIRDWPRVLTAQYEKIRDDGEKVTHTRTQSLPINAEVVQYVQDTTSLLWFWVQLILQTNPTHAGPDSIDAKTTARYLATNLDTLIAADEDVTAGLRDETTTLTRRARHYAHPETRSRRVTIGIHCPEPGCDGTLEARLKPRMDMIPDLVCNQDRHHHVPPSEFRRIARNAEYADAIITARPRR